VVLTEEEVSVVAVVVLTEAVVGASVEEADFTGVAVVVVAVVPAQAVVVALPEADLTSRPLTRGLIAKHRRQACGA
jgi:hypothetical protein